MEEGKGSSSSSSSSPSSSRWNPTKEQITILEGLYKQGIRTPSAEQIQQITGKLREYGSIEGKNVFYWFQNHKARQRQKQKQESFAYFSRLLHYAQPSPPLPRPAAVPLPPGCANVVCNPYYTPVQQVTSVIGFQQPPQFPNVFFQAGAMNKSTPHINFQRNVVALQENSMEPISSSINVPPAGYDLSNQAADMAFQIEFGSTKNDRSFSSETLQLFPLHPTGILQRERSGSSRMSPSVESAGSLEDEQEELVSAEKQTFNFLAVPSRKI